MTGRVWIFGTLLLSSRLYAQRPEPTPIDPLVMAHMVQEGGPKERTKAVELLTGAIPDQLPEHPLPVSVFYVQLDSDPELEVVIDLSVSYDVHVVTVWDRLNGRWVRAGKIGVRTNPGPGPVTSVVDFRSTPHGKELLFRSFFKGSDDSGNKLDVYVLHAGQVQKVFSTVEEYEYRDFKPKPDIHLERSFQYRPDPDGDYFILRRTRVTWPLSDVAVVVPIDVSGAAPGILCVGYRWRSSQHAYTEDGDLTSRFCDARTKAIRWEPR